MRAAVIADDLTGAADTAAQFARAGYRTAVAFRGAPVPPAAGLDAVALDTDSRAMAADSAAKRVLEASRAVRDAAMVYKKVDSTLRGPLAEELAAAVGATGRGPVVVAPAFPAAGRTTARGVQLVRGVPVHETEAARDPRTPVVESHLPTLLARAFPSVVALRVEELADAATVRRALESAPCVVADARRDGDLDALVRAVPDPRGVLWAGSAGLALALGRAYPGPRAGESRSTRAPAPAPARAVLAVVGSLSGVARRQLRSLAKHGCTLVPVATGERSAAAARAALAGGSSCAALHSAGERDSTDAGAVLGALAEVAAGLAQDGLFDALVLTGGETALGVARKLGAVGILLEGEALPGVPLGTLIGPSPYRVVTKAGGFGEPDTLTQVVKDLLQSGEDPESCKHPL